MILSNYRHYDNLICPKYLPPVPFICFLYYTLCVFRTPYTTHRTHLFHTTPFLPAFFMKRMRTIQYSKHRVCLYLYRLQTNATWRFTFFSNINKPVQFCFNPVQHFQPVQHHQQLFSQISVNTFFHLFYFSSNL